MVFAFILGLIGNIIFHIVHTFFPKAFTKSKGTIPRSVARTGVEEKGEGAPRRQVAYAKELVATSIPGGDTPARLFRLSVEKFGSRNAMGTRTVREIRKEEKKFTKNGKTTTKIFDMPYCTDYAWRTYAQIGDEVIQYGAGLAKLGLRPGQFVSVYGNTRPEWQLAAQACFAHGFPIATVYASLGMEAVAYSLAEGKIEYVITEHTVVDTLIEASAKCDDLKHVLLMEDVSAERLEEFTKRAPKLKFYNWSAVLELGKAKEAPVQAPESKDLAVIMYTSGSTGNPKGVMMTHGNIVAAVAGVSLSVPALNENDVYIAYLPLAHILEMAAEMAQISVGAAIGYGSAQRLQDAQAYNLEGKPLGDLRALRPTLMASVPLILDRIKAAIEERVKGQSPVVQKLFAFAYKLKKREWLAGRTRSFWDKIIFSKMAAPFGGRLRLMLAGGAPLSASTQEFISLAFSCHVLQGYGLTETCGGGTISDWRDRKTAIVGPSIPSCEIKLVDVPDMNYFHTDTLPRGEIAIRGHNVTLGYYKLQKQTDESYKRDAEGNMWFYTGDIGQWERDGNLKIIDRKKDLVKLSHGEYIALGKLEAVYGGSRYVDFVCIYADSKHSAPVALVVPKVEILSTFARGQGIPTEDFAAVCANPKVIAEVRASLLAEAKKVKLSPTEQPAAIHLCAEPWTPATGLVTDAFKLKRNVITDRFRTVLEELYVGV